MGLSKNSFAPLLLILLVYLVIAGLFATRIPAWQVPDEPAHYNYVRQLAQTGQFPVLEPSDWNRNFNPPGPGPAHYWIPQFFRDLDFWQRYIDRYQDVRQGPYSLTNLYAIIDRMVGEVTEAQLRLQGDFLDDLLVED